MLANALPNDIDTLKRMLVSRDETIAKLVAEIARLKRWQYGRSSERVSELMVNRTGLIQLVRRPLSQAGNPTTEATRGQCAYCAQCP